MEKRKMTTIECKSCRKQSRIRLDRSYNHSGYCRKCKIIGAKNPNWRGGTNPRASEYLRNKVLKRDNNECQICGYEKNLDIHHKNTISKGGLTVMENLVTLCRSCHRQLHNTISKHLFAQQIKS